MKCYCFLRNVLDLMANGKTPWQKNARTQINSLSHVVVVGSYDGVKPLLYHCHCWAVSCGTVILSYRGTRGSRSATPSPAKSKRTSNARTIELTIAVAVASRPQARINGFRPGIEAAGSGLQGTRRLEPSPRACIHYADTVDFQQ